jgi:uncharacterized membrane-anchored protein
LEKAARAIEAAERLASDGFLEFAAGRAWIPASTAGCWTRSIGE